MFDIGTLDTIIAMVIVLLVLSLVVQSIQTIIKKLLKMKSTIVMHSLEDLFQYVDTNKLIGKLPQDLVAQVSGEFKKLGRRSLLRRNPMLDSISKGDLQKILRRLGAEKIEQDVETWFDTVMQGFDERYTRHMKTLAIIVSFAVVIILNANFFRVYRNIAASDVLRAQILSQGSQIQKEAAKAAERKPRTSTSPSPTPKPLESPATGSSEATPQPSPAVSPAPDTTTTGGTSEDDEINQQTQAELKQLQANTEAYLAYYEGFGFTPLKPRQVIDFVTGAGQWQGIPFGARLVHGGKVLLGWIIMTILLSVGAPFWQDALESLFGLKSLIRQKGQQQNVEAASGSGQPKP